MAKRTCSVKYFCLGSFLIFVGSVLLCALGFTVVLPHEATRDWAAATCNVTNASYDIATCACNQQVTAYDDCMSKYPCLQVHVTFTDLRPDPGTPTLLTRIENGVDYDDSRNNKYNSPQFAARRDANLIPYNNTGMLFRYWADAFHKKCALYECGDEPWNIKEVKRFKRNWGNKGQTFRCYHDPYDPYYLILERTPTIDMIHAILWPSLALGTGSIIWMGVCFGCWKIEMEAEAERYSPQSPYGLL